MRPLNLLLSLLAGAALAACGGGDDNTPSNTGGGKLTVSAANPGAHNGDIDVETATTKGNSARAADGFSTLPYCEIFFENALSSNGTRYRVQVYFRQGDKAVLHTSIMGGTSGWVVFHNNSGNPITGITVDTTARRLTYTAKVLSGGSGEAGTVNGTVSFPANSGTPACGA
ncbi:MAG: hypothetical protein ACKVQR_01455 [Aquabacterium sp.]